MFFYLIDGKKGTLQKMLKIIKNKSVNNIGQSNWYLHIRNIFCKAPRRMKDVQIIINCTLNIDFLSDHIESVDLNKRGASNK